LQCNGLLSHVEERVRLRLELFSIVLALAANRSTLSRNLSLFCRQTLSHVAVFVLEFRECINHSMPLFARRAPGTRDRMLNRLQLNLCVLLYGIFAQAQQGKLLLATPFFLRHRAFNDCHGISCDAVCLQRKRSSTVHWRPCNQRG